MKYKKPLLYILIAVSAIYLAGCSRGESAAGSAEAPGPAQTAAAQTAAAYPMTVTDSFGREIKLDKEPERIISVAPNITEVIYALDRSSRLVGRTDYDDYPEDVKKVASVGALKEPNIEKIVELKPDLVIASTHFKKETVQKLEELGIKIAVFYGEESFEGVYDTIGKVGAVLNAKDGADRLVADMKAKVADVLDKVKDKPAPSVYYVVSYGKSGDHTAGGDTFIGQMITMAGGRNAAADVKGWSYSLEKLVEKNPDVIICTKFYDTKKGIENTNGYKDLAAVKGGKLFEIDNNLLDRQGPRLADGLTELARIIHPEAFK